MSVEYVAWVNQNGEGCDYTIGCGHNLYALKAKTMEEAITEAEKMVLETVGYAWAERYGDVTIYEISDAYNVRVERVYRQEEERLAALAAQEIEQMERALYERLRDKYVVEQ